MKKLSCQQFAEGEISQYIRRFREESRRVRQGRCREALHQMRVASRRLRNSLWVVKNIFPKENYKEWTQNIRKVARLSGQARDLDVHIIFLNEFGRKIKNSRYRSGMDKLENTLQEQRQKIQPKIIQALDDLEKKKVFAAIFASQKKLFLSPLQKKERKLLSVAQKKIIQRLNELLKLERYVYSPTKVKKLHEMRIATKHLRYTLEGFSLLYGAMIQPFITAARRFQRILGELHDYDMWIATLPGLMVKHNTDQNYKAALLKLHDYCQEERAKIYKKFVRLWESCRSERKWSQLTDIVANNTSRPLLMTAIEPPPLK